MPPSLFFKRQWGTAMHACGPDSQEAVEEIVLQLRNFKQFELKLGMEQENEGTSTTLDYFSPLVIFNSAPLI